METTEAAVLAVEAAGADLVELGIPFSDPIADGPVIQKAGERALAFGIGLAQVLQMVRDFRSRDTATPIGPGCKLCEREACPQRAFPMIGRPALAEPGRSSFAPYSSESLP